ncbi:MAG: flagellar hook assembly protein FlgD [Desulfitobacteriaceae bacterium]
MSIPGITSSTSITNNNSNQAVSTAVNKALGKDDFLKLLITELKNQDPLQPMDNKDFIAQMAQFSSLEQMNNVASAINNLNTNMTVLNLQSLITQCSSLIGKQVSGQNENGDDIKGIVDSVKLIEGSVQLQIGDKTLYINEITDIATAASSVSV